LLRRRRLPRRRLGARLHPWNSAEGGRADPVHLSGVVMTHYEWRKRPDDRAKRLRIGHLHPKASAHERQVPVRPDELPDLDALGCAAWHMRSMRQDRKSTRLNSSHEWISYAVFC